MGTLIDITGNRYDRLIVIKRSYNDKDNFIRWECLCDCGKITYVRAQSLKERKVKSCGCLNNEKRSERVKIHGLSKTPIYFIWKGMRQRCYNPKNKRFHRYGGRGIKICEEWEDPKSFIKWALENGYKKGLTIERENNDSNYAPDNCCFVTTKINNQNSSNCTITKEIAIKIKDEYKSGNITQKELSKRYGITQQTISKIIRGKLWT